MLTEYKVIPLGHRETINGVEVKVLSCKINEKGTSVYAEYTVFGDTHKKNFRVEMFEKPEVVSIYNIGSHVYVPIKGHLIYGIIRMVNVLVLGYLEYTVSYESICDDEQETIICSHKDIKDPANILEFPK